MIIKTIVALAPVLLVWAFVYLRSKDKKMDFKYVALFFALGVLSVFPLRYIERFLYYIVLMPFSSDAVQLFTSRDSGNYTFEVYILIIVMQLIDAALAEEGMKFCIFTFLQKKFKPINTVYDSIVCAVSVSLGFAALENLLYILSKGIGSGLLRAFLAIPGHAFYGIIMGYLYSLYLVKTRAAAEEKKLMDEGVIPAGNNLISGRRELILSFALPIALHTFNNTCTMNGHLILLALLYVAFVIFMYIYCIRKILNVSRNNISIEDCAADVLIKKYSK